MVVPSCVASSGYIRTVSTPSCRYLIGDPLSSLGSAVAVNLTAEQCAGSGDDFYRLAACEAANKNYDQDEDDRLEEKVG